jgi:hypothetical protein
MKKAYVEAKEKAVREIAKGIPLIMYGSGATSFEATNLIATLTVEYIADLVSAALECSEYEFPDQQRLPPPPVKRKQTTTKKRTSGAPSYFDDPLPKPKICKTSAATTPTTPGGTTLPAAAAAASAPPQHDPDEPYVAATKAWDTEEPAWIVPSDPLQHNWRGVLGLDIFQHHRRPRAVTGLSSQHVLFSLCQDPYAYGRIREAQADKETILAPLLIDPVVRETLSQQAKLLQLEERLIKKIAAKATTSPSKKKTSAAVGSSATKNNKNNKANVDASDEEEEEEVAAEAAAASSEEEDKKPAWPSLDGLLPVREALDR